MKIEDYIPEGRENAVSRRDLIPLLGKGERNIRQQIKEANKRLGEQGKAILSSSAWKGYWISDDLNEMEEYLREQERRVNTQKKNDSPIRELVARKRGNGLVLVGSYTRRKRRDKPAGQEKWEV